MYTITKELYPAFAKLYEFASHVNNHEIHDDWEVLFRLVGRSCGPWAITYTEEERGAINRVREVYLNTKDRYTVVATETSVSWLPYYKGLEGHESYVK
mgnify:CR=1 FL=1